MAACEPPYVHESGQPAGADHEAQLARLIAGGDRRGGVRYFMRSMVGVPAPAVFLMRLMPWIWRKLKAVAHTLPFDAAVMDGFQGIGILVFIGSGPSVWAG